MDLGLAMVAGNAAFDRMNANELRERERQRYEWERQRAEAEIGLLPDKTAAERSGFQLKSSQNQQGMELLPGDTQNKLTRQGIEGTQLAGEQSRLPTTEATKNIEAGMGLNKAASDSLSQGDKLTTDRNTAKIAASMSNLDVEELPRTLAQKRLANEVTAADADLMIGAKLSDLIDAGDQASIIRLLNAQKRTIQDPKIAGLPDVASVSRATDANGAEFLVLKDAQGNQIMARPVESYRAAKNALAKIGYEKIDAGDSLVRVQGGRVTPVFTAPESLKSTAAKAGPTERDINYYMREFGLSKEDAERKVTATKTMSREQFVLKAVQENTPMGRDPKPGDMEKWGKFYDDVMGKGVIQNAPRPSVGAPPAAGSNSSVPPTMNVNPAVRSLLGLP